MPMISVHFKPNTSRQWVSEKFTELGLVESLCEVGQNNRFFFLDRPPGFIVRIQVQDGKEYSLMRVLNLISPQIKEISKA